MFNGNELNLRIQLFMLFSTPRISLLHLWRKNGGGSARFDVLTAVKIRVEIFWVVTPCNDSVGYQRFEDLAAGIFMVQHQDSLKHWYPVPTLHGVRTQKTWS
jgi:hypothetical protein